MNTLKDNSLIFLMGTKRQYFSILLPIGKHETNESMYKGNFREKYPFLKIPFACMFSSLKSNIKNSETNIQ